MISIIDYGAGNLKSVEKAIKYLGYHCEITRDKDVILSSKRVILPGVGAFGDAMASLRKANLENVIYDLCDKKIKLMGICLGMQMMFEESEETKGVLGLGIFKGKVKRFSDDLGLKVPQMGWNNISVKKNGGMFKDVKNPYVYFVHSYFLDAVNKESVAAVCEYGIPFDAAYEEGNVSLCQFHPEKSGEEGLKILNNFLCEVK